MIPLPVKPVASEVDLLLNLLPVGLRNKVGELNTGDLLEIILDLGRPLEARLGQQDIRFDELLIQQSDLNYIIHRVGEFGGDNRVGIPRTLHRISAIRSRSGQIVGLTLRVGRAVFGTIDLLQDLLKTGKNILLLGRPGVGKTTKLREMARVLSDQLKKRVIVVDTSNEIGGDGDIAHPAIGSARRMQVAHPNQQHATMIEAVENHMPEVIIVDEIGTFAETAAARTIAERGVQLIGTAHGTTLENLVMNPTLSDVVGGVHVVTLSDEEARRQKKPKTATERKAPPTFDIIVELVGRNEVVIHRDTATAVDMVLSGQSPEGETLRQDLNGKIQKATINQISKTIIPTFTPPLQERPTHIYTYELNRPLLDRVIRNLDIEARTVNHLENADIILALRSHGNDSFLSQILEQGSIPIHFVKKDTATFMRKTLQDLFSKLEGLESGEVREALQETEHAIQRVLSEQMEISLVPRKPPIRKMQHRIVSRYHLHAESVGHEPYRHLIIRMPSAQGHAA